MHLEELKKKFTLRISLGIAALLFIAILAFGFFWQNRESNQQNQARGNGEEINLIHWRRTEKFKVAAWVPDWSTTQSVESMKLSGPNLSNLSPVWHEVKENGDLVDKTPLKAKELLRESGKLGIEITPSVALFDYTVLTAVLSNPENFQRHVDSLIKLGTTAGYDGLDIDYEQIQLSDKEKFFELLQKVGDGLHAQGKILSVAVLPKWGDDIVYKGLRETRQVQDWSRIASIADEVRVMTYDYSGQGSPKIGPIGPLNWQEQVIQYGLTKMPKEKLVLGVHLYAYEKWVEVGEDVKANDFSNPKLIFEPDFNKHTGKNDSSRAYSYTQVTKALTENQGQTEEYEGEKIFSYSKTNTETGKLENRVMVYIDAGGVQDRINLAEKYKLRGVAFWRLGSEKDLLQNLKIPKV